MTNTADMLEFNNFVKFTSEFFSDWKLETGNKDDIFLTTFAGVLLLLRKRNLLVDVEKKDVTVTDTQEEVVITNFIDRSSNNVTVVNSREHRDNVFAHDLQSLVLGMLNVYSSYTGEEGDDLPCVKKYVCSLQELNDDFAFNMAFDHLLKMLAEQHFEDGFIHIPIELNKFSLELVDLNGSNRMYNPCAGIGTCALLLPEGVEYLGEEENIDLWRLGMINLAINERRNVEYKRVNPYETISSLQKAGDYTIASFPPLSYDSFVDYKSFDLSAQKWTMHNHELIRDFEVNLYKEFFYVCEHKSFCIVPSSILNNTNDLYVNMRKSVTYNEDEIFISNVILLPENLFPGTNIQTAIISTYDLNTENCIRMIDMSNCYHKGLDGKNVLDYELAKSILDDESSEYSCRIDFEDLEGHNHSWDPCVYLYENRNKSNDGIKMCKIGEIISIMPCIEVDFDETEGHLVTYDDLSKSEMEGFIDSLNNLPIRKLPEDVYKMTSPAIIVSLHKSLRPTLCMASEESPIFVTKGIVPIVYKSDSVTPLYLLHFLWNIDSKKHFRGIIEPYITLEDFGEIQVPMLPVEQQKAVVSEWRRIQEKHSIEEAGLKEIVEEMKTEYMDEIRMRKHDMKPYVAELLDAHELLTYYVNRMELNETNKTEINTLLSRMHISLSSLASALDRLNEEETFGIPVVVNLDNYLLELVKQYQTERYSVSVQIDNAVLIEDGIRQEPLVVIAKEDLDNLCRNIINNAIVHGFTDSECVDYEINIRLSVDLKNRMFVVDFCNNGTPFPDGLTKERYGLKGEKAGSTGHTGIGGHRVKSITRHYKGDYDLFYNADSNFPNVIRVYLPIK